MYSGCSSRNFRGAECDRTEFLRNRRVRDGDAETIAVAKACCGLNKFLKRCLLSFLRCHDAKRQSAERLWSCAREAKHRRSSLPRHYREDPTDRPQFSDGTGFVDPKGSGTVRRFEYADIQVPPLRGSTLWKYLEAGS